MSPRPWSISDKQFLLENMDLGVPTLAEMLQRTPVSVAAMLGGLHNAWMSEEDAFIRATAHLTARAVADQMPHRSYEAVRTRRQVLGVKSDGSNKSPYRIGKRTLLAKTCPRCGLLLDASWFTKTTTRTWVSACSRCKPDYHPDKSRPRHGPDRTAKEVAREFRERQQALTIPTATNSGNEWTEADVKVLANPDLSNLEKALRLRRTYVATCQAVSRRGFASRTGKGDPANGQWIIRNPNQPSVESAA